MIATHSRKVRWPTRLDCGCYVTGGRKYEIPGRGWCCRDCAGIKQLMETPPRPGRGGETEGEVNQ